MAAIAEGLEDGSSSDDADALDTASADAGESKRQRLTRARKESKNGRGSSVVTAPAPADTAGPQESRLCVASRLRPLNGRERSRDERSVWTALPGPRKLSCSMKEMPTQGRSGRTTTLHDRGPYSHVFSPAFDTTAVYDAVGRPIVEGVLDGFNGTIFAYGQTGSGYGALPCWLPGWLLLLPVPDHPPSHPSRTCTAKYMLHASLVYTSFL